jgi:hypothetical protein
LHERALLNFGLVPKRQVPTFASGLKKHAEK